MKNFADIITDYALRFHSKEEQSSDNTVSSPLGSWLLLASLAASLDFSETTEQKKEIEQVLGTTIKHASELSVQVLADERLKYTARVWSNPQLVTKFPGITKWLSANKNVPAENFIPSQNELDDWVQEHTHGLIKKFPLEAAGADEFVFIIANILYLKFEWRKPFRVVADEIMSHTWQGNEFLLSDSYTIHFYEHKNKLYMTYDVQAKTGEVVTLVTSYDDAPDQSRLLDAAYHIKVAKTAALVSHETIDPKDRLFTVEHVQGFSPIVEQGLVPAWEAASKHDLYGSPEYGYQAIAEVLTHGCEPDEVWDAQAAQSAVAKFKADGFEAAAVTAFGLTRAGAFFPPREEQIRYTARFSQSFAYICMLDETPVFAGFVQQNSGETR